MRKSIYLVFAVALIFTCSHASAQIFMKALDGNTKLNGGSVVNMHSGEIELLSYSHGESGCATCNVANLSDYSILIALSPATISFKKLLFLGRKLTSVSVSYLRPGETPFTYYKVYMEDVTVTSVQESGASPELPYISVSIHPDRIAWQLISQNPDGSVGPKTTYGWDAVNNVEFTHKF